MQENRAFQNKTCEQIVFKNFNRLSYFLHAYNNDNKGLSSIHWEPSPKCLKTPSTLGPDHQSKHLKLLALCFQVLMIRGVWSVLYDCLGSGHTGVSKTLRSVFQGKASLLADKILSSADRYLKYTSHPFLNVVFSASRWL